MIWDDKENPASPEDTVFARISILAALAMAKPLVALMQEDDDDEDTVFARVNPSCSM